MIDRTQKKEIDLLDIWRIALKRKWIIIAFAAIFLMVAGLRSMLKTPVYQANTTILIEDPNSTQFDIQEIMGSSTYGSYSYLGTYFNTQLKLLTSRSLAERVARKIDLKNRRELQTDENQKKSLVQTVKGLFSFSWLRGSKKETESEEDQDVFVYRDPDIQYAFTVLGGLSVSPVEETRLVNLSYSSYYPVLAADIVNAIAEEFINYSVEMRYEATQQASEFLSGQITEIRVDLTAKERELQKYGEEQKILYLKEEENTVVSKFGDYSKAYTEAQLDRYKKEAAYRELRDLKVDSLPQYVSNPIIDSLRSQYAQLRIDYNEKLRFYKPEYPEMQSLQAKINGLQTQLRDEIGKAVEVASVGYQEALKREASLRNVLESQRQDVVETNNAAILYNSLKIEVETKRELLNSLVSRQNETLVSARLRGLKTSNIRIVDKALVPGSPLSRNTSRNLFIALFLGVFLGVGLSFFIEYLDNTIHDPEELKKLTELPSLGVVPFISPNGAKDKSAYRSGYRNSSINGYKGGHQKGQTDIKEIEMVNHLFPSHSVSEDYRTIRTSILFSHADSPPKVITFSSSFPEEGKTATTSNVAISFSQLEKKVLLIDGDMRRSRLHKVFKVRNLNGLSSYLTGKIDFEKAVQQTPVKNLYMISSGPIPPNPAELLNSQRMKTLIDDAKKSFDIILIDSPPVLAVIDPIILSSMSDSTILVVRQGKTNKKAFVKAVEELQKGASRLIGVIFNEVKLSQSGKYYSSGYYKYMEEYYADGETGQ